jgi:hypothetical protein
VGGRHVRLCWDDQRESRNCSQEPHISRSNKKSRPETARAAGSPYFTSPPTDPAETANLKVGGVTHKLKFFIPILVLSTSCLAQEALTIRTQGKQKPPADAQKIYLSACSAVQRQFATNRVPRPQVTLVIGGDINRADWDRRDIHFAKWDRYLFAQGVVFFAFEELLPTEQRRLVAKRAVTWADSTVESITFGSSAMIALCCPSQASIAEDLSDSDALPRTQTRPPGSSCVLREGPATTCAATACLVPHRAHAYGSLAEWPIAKFSWLADHGRVTIALAIPMATLQFPH